VKYKSGRLIDAVDTNDDECWPGWFSG